jgi:hypothetical protein
MFTMPLFRVPDPHIRLVSLLCHFDGANGSMTITDSGPNGFVLAGSGSPSPSISTSQSVFSGSSCLFSGGRLASPNNPLLRFSGADFTVEFRLRLNSLIHEMEVFGQFGPDGTGPGWTVYVNPDFLNFYYDHIGPVVVPPPSVGAWTSYAITRSGSTVRMFVDGVLKSSSAAFPPSLADTTTVDFRIGGRSTPSLDGYLDELRITKGLARYTASYAPAVRPFPGR